MACWRGICKHVSKGACNDDAVDAATQRAAMDGSKWTIPSPSPAYDMASDLREKENRTRSNRLPPELKEEMQQWRQQILDMDAKQQKREPQPSKNTEFPSSCPYELKVIDEGNSSQQPKVGETVRLGYILVLKEDGAVVDQCANFEHRIGATCRGAGQVSPAALEWGLTQMKRGDVVAILSKLQHLLPATSPSLDVHGSEASAVLEVRLFEIYSSKDCSFIKGSGVIMKEVVKQGVGAWCDNPTDEGFAHLRIEEVRYLGLDDKDGKENGCRLFPLAGSGPAEARVAVGDGAVCDALEAALLEMRQHETAIVTCSDPGMCCGGVVFAGLDIPANGVISIRVTLLDYNSGPDIWNFEEEDRLTFAHRRKLEAARLFSEGRFYLARERYRRVVDLFHHIDQHKLKERFDGKPDLLQDCKDFRKLCLLNVAACSIKLHDGKTAKTNCDVVLRADPENTKALYRRGQAHIQTGDYVEACHDLARLLDVDGSLEEAQRLLEKATRLRELSDRRQKKSFNYGRMIDNMRRDPRSIVHDYMDTPVDVPGVEGAPISARWVPKKVAEIEGPQIVA